MSNYDESLAGSPAGFSERRQVQKGGEQNPSLLRIIVTIKFLTSYYVCNDKKAIDVIPFEG